jgi:hypothetical protein
MTSLPFRNLPYFSDLVCNDIVPSPNIDCTSATSRSPSWKKVRICSSSDSSLRLCECGPCQRVKCNDCSKGAHTCTPPGKLMEESIRIASVRPSASTLHRRGPTCKRRVRSMLWYNVGRLSCPDLCDSPNYKIAYFSTISELGEHIQRGGLCACPLVW